MAVDNNDSMKGTEKKKKFTDVQTDKRNYEHLTDENDVISEEDINNIKTDESITIANDTESAIPEELPQENEKDKKEDGNNDPGIQTSWNIIE